MKSREFGTWPLNVFGSKGKKRYDEYNRSFKKERPEQPKEYASTEIEEYYRVPAQKDVSGNPYEQYGKKSESKKKNDAKSLKRQLLIRQAVGILVGSVVIVTSYQTVTSQQQQNSPDQPAIVQPGGEGSGDPFDPSNPDKSGISVEWIWSEDNQTAVLKLKDSKGNEKEIPATVSVSEKEATCEEEGVKTYTATAEYGEKNYSDTHTEKTSEALGHIYEGGGDIAIGDGQPVEVTGICPRCHQEITFKIGATEND